MMQEGRGRVKYPDEPVSSVALRVRFDSKQPTG